MKKLLALALVLVLALGMAFGAVAEEKKTIYLILKVIGNQYWAVLQQGAEKAAEDLGCELVVVGVASESDIEGQITFLQNAVSTQADGIVIGPVDSVSLANPVREVYESGTPIVLVDTTVDGDQYSAELMTNNVTAGEIAGEEMLNNIKKLGVSEDEEIVIAIQMGSAGSQTIIDRVKGFNTFWDANAPKNWKVLNDDLKVNDGDVSRAVGFCQDFLTTYPNLRGVFGPNNGSTVGFVTGLVEAKATDVAMVGFDFSAEIENMINSGDFIVSSVVQQQYAMGYDGVKTALELSNGGAVETKSIDTGVMLVNADNIGTDEVNKVLGR